MSTTKTKYIVLGYAARKVMWIRQFINKVKLEVVENIILHSNNEISIEFTKNAESEDYTKYIDMWYHYIKE